MLQFHDVNFALWKEYAARGSYDSERFRRLLGVIVDWDLFLMFLVIDGSTTGKDPEKIRWFVNEVRKYKNTNVDDSWLESYGGK